MAVFTVHQPPPCKNEDTASPERFAFVRDGFYFWAFLLGPLWMLWNRLWLVLVLYLAGTAAIHAALWALGVSGAVKFAVALLIAILIGCEAGSLRRWTLRRRGWTQVGLVVAPTQEAAERRFFETWSADAVPPRAAAAPPPASTRIPEPAPDVIGLFPEPQSRP